MSIIKQSLPNTCTNIALSYIHINPNTACLHGWYNRCVGSSIQLLLPVRCILCYSIHQSGSIVICMLHSVPLYPSTTARMLNPVPFHPSTTAYMPALCYYNQLLLPVCYHVPLYPSTTACMLTIAPPSIRGGLLQPVCCTLYPSCYHSCFTIFHGIWLLSCTLLTIASWK